MPILYFKSWVRKFIYTECTAHLLVLIMVSNNQNTAVFSSKFCICNIFCLFYLCQICMIKMHIYLFHLLCFFEMYSQSLFHIFVSDYINVFRSEQIGFYFSLCIPRNSINYICFEFSAMLRKKLLFSCSILLQWIL